MHAVSTPEIIEGIRPKKIDKGRIASFVTIPGKLSQKSGLECIVGFLNILIALLMK